MVNVLLFIATSTYCTDECGHGDAVVVLRYDWLVVNDIIIRGAITYCGMCAYEVIS